MPLYKTPLFIALLLYISGKAQPLPNFSGIYPHLAMYNNEGECGTGAVVPWAGKLWVVTYGPHLPHGSSDKLYEINEKLGRKVRQESIGGTPANRMIHRESNQLFIGPYAIRANGQVRTIPYTKMPGRHTANARHLTDPAGKIYYATMEEGFYEVDVATLNPVQLYRDLNVTGKAPGLPADLPGAHGKGAYSGQGVLVYSNNGEPGEKAKTQFDIEAGVLAEWDGRQWQTVRRNQFVDVTGPGGLYGNADPASDPIWATGWDHKSVLLGMRRREGWTFYRLPKGSHSYDGAHGWNTEWPRIRDVGTPGKPDYLMTMHGLFWRFPAAFGKEGAAGIRPRSAYLKVIGDYARWRNGLVFGCDDSAQKEFLNLRKIKGGIEGPGQSNSNLWFTDVDRPDRLGPGTAEGAVWLAEQVHAGERSEPFLFAGWNYRSVWIANHGSRKTGFLFETDTNGNGKWQELQRVEVNPGGARQLLFGPEQTGEWVRVKTDTDTEATVHFSYTDTSRYRQDRAPLFKGLAGSSREPYLGGLLYGLADNRWSLGVLAGKMTGNGFEEKGYYELDEKMNLVRKEDTLTASFIRTRFAIAREVVQVDEASVLVTDDRGRRWRFPKGDDANTPLIHGARTRICREVATERDLLNLHGTFYELPAENADGFAKVRPVATHNLPIHDYASYRGLLVMTGIERAAGKNKHIIRSADGQAALWAGTIDDLWELGKPTGEGGPWHESPVRAGKPSDPYLIGFYDRKTLRLSHDAGEDVLFRLEADPVGNGTWMLYNEIKVSPGEVYRFDFPAGFQARWIRFRTDKDCRATAWLKYD